MDILTTILDAADRTVIVENNFEKIDRSLAFKLTPSLDLTDTPTTDLGAPSAGAHVLDELWVDALCAIFRCTAAGTPGTWIQIAPATILTADLPASAPANYLVRLADGPWVDKYWDGAAWQTL